jgi:hypothetical protein
MSELRAEMLTQMRLHRLAPKTQVAYVGAVKGLARFYHTSPDQLTPVQVQDYLHDLLVHRRRSWSTCNIAINAFRFLYGKTLKRDLRQVDLPRCRREQKRPEVLSPEEVERLLTTPGNPKHRALLMPPAQPASASAKSSDSSSATSTACGWPSASGRARDARTARRSSLRACWRNCAPYLSAESA